MQSWMINFDFFENEKIFDPDKQRKCSTCSTEFYSDNPKEEIF